MRSTVTTRGGDGDVSEVDVTAQASGPAPEVGQPAQDFTAVTLEGETVSLSDFRGRPVLEDLEHRLHPWSAFLVVPLRHTVYAPMALGS